MDREGHTLVSRVQLVQTMPCTVLVSELSSAWSISEIQWHSNTPIGLVIIDFAHQSWVKCRFVVCCAMFPYLLWTLQVSVGELVLSLHPTTEHVPDVAGVAVASPVASNTSPEAGTMRFGLANSSETEQNTWNALLHGTLTPYMAIPKTQTYICI